MGGLSNAIGGLLGSVGGFGQTTEDYINALDRQQAYLRAYTGATSEEDRYHKLRRERKKLAGRRLLERAEGKEEGVVINKFLLGCDPEFVALDSMGRILNGTSLGQGEIG